jgi:hypothetical protein
MPEVTFVGKTATCRTTLNTQDGNPPADVYGGSAMMGWDGLNFVDITDQVNWSAPVQTVNFTWEMAATTVYAHMFVFLVNSCGEGDNVPHQTAYYEYTEGVADITATDITVTPSTCEAPCDIAVSITWENVGSMQGTFVPKFSIKIILQPGGSYTMTQTLFNMPAGNYVICPSPN